MYKINFYYISIIFILLINIMLSFGRNVAMSAENLNEYQIKAQYIWFFAELVNWPNTNNDLQKVLCTIGEDPFISEFDELSQQTEYDNFSELKRNIDFADINKCHILFISNSEQHNLFKILRKVKDQPILTISDIVGFASKDGIIEFVNNNGYINLIINHSVAQRSDLKISAKLLKISLKIL